MTVSTGAFTASFPVLLKISMEKALGTSRLELSAFVWILSANAFVHRKKTKIKLKQNRIVGYHGTGIFAE